MYQNNTYAGYSDYLVEQWGNPNLGMVKPLLTELSTPVEHWGNNDNSGQTKHCKITFFSNNWIDKALHNSFGKQPKTKTYFVSVNTSHTLPNINSMEVKRCLQFIHIFY